MSRNGSGTYNLPAGNPVVTGTTISSTWANNTMNDLAAALTGSVAADGQTPMTGDLNLNNNKIVNLTAGTMAGDAVEYSQATSAVAITGGSVNNTPIGASTPNTGAFTTLSASGNTSLTTLSASGNVSLDGGTFVFNDAGADKDARFEGDTDANLLFLDASTNRVGIGTSTPTEKFTVENGKIEGKNSVGTIPTTLDTGELFALFNLDSAYTTDQRVISLGASIFSNGSSYEASSGYIRSTGILSLITGSTERVRVGFDGSVGIGLTDDNAATMDDKAGFFLNDDGNLIVSHKDANATGYYASFVYDGLVRGAIQGSSGGAAVAYNSFSDHRLKENVAPMTGALDKVARLKPVTYKWKSNGLDADGFIAHELQEVCPQAVSGEKDAVDEDGKPIYQGVDTSFLVATLTAAIQEQQAIINDLKARIETLEAK